MESFREPMVTPDIGDRLDRLEELLLSIIELLLAEGSDEDDDPADPSTTLDDATVGMVHADDEL